MPHDDALHEVRIRAKRARYAAEATEPVFGKKARKFARAMAEIEVLQEAYRRREGGRSEKELELRLWETQGIYLCQTGSPDPGLKLLSRCVDKTKDDFSHHSWGNLITIQMKATSPMRNRADIRYGSYLVRIAS